MTHREKLPTHSLVVLGLIASCIAMTLGFISCGKPELPEQPGTSVEEQGPLPYGTLPAGQNFAGEKNFAYLINNFTVGQPERTPWVGFWWPYTSNGIASGRYGGGLSPAGKYDAARGGRTSAQFWEVRNHGSAVPKVQGWWGHCNGWAAASALYPEPRVSKKVNGITFDVSDIKALLTEVSMEVSADFYGNRVDWGQDYNSYKYDDVIPNQYFLILTNYMGKLHQAVLIDRYTGDQVWNQPAVAYHFEYPKREDYLGPSPEAPNIYRINLTSTIYWGRDDVDPGAITAPFNFETNQYFEGRTLKLELWLDGPVEFGPDGKIVSSGNIVIARKGDALVGGVWKNGSGYLIDGHPDYMWIPYSVLKPNAEEPYANIHIDYKWVEQYVLTGTDDLSTNPLPITPAPQPCPRPSSGPSGVPVPRPTPTFTPVPTPTVPQPTPTLVPVPVPPPPAPPRPAPTSVPRPPRR
jgi:hypothetical protein